MEVRILVYLLFAVAVMKSAVANTFSSKLIHRFSEEAMGIRVSRKGEIASLWPKKKSREYYRLLASNDMQRQKMKLGGQYKYLFPSEGSLMMSSGNDFGWLHYTWIDVGTPNASFLVALDSGSDLLWLPCDCIQCAPLSSSYYSNLDRDLGEYSPSGSSTSKHLSCSHEQCERGSSCKSPKQPCPYIVKYTSENTSSSGLLVEDILHFASSSDRATKSFVQAPVIIGCGRQQSGAYLDGVAPDGVMGLGLANISVPSLLAKVGLVRNSFSMCFDEDDSGRIFFGDHGVTTQQSTPFLPLDGKYIKYMVGVGGCCVGTSCLKQCDFQALVDSGTSFTFLPVKVYEKVVAEFDRKVSVTRASYAGYPWEYCYESSSQEMFKIPALTFMFPLNNSFVVHNPTFPVHDSQGIQGVIGFCLAVQPTEADFGTIGQNFMIGYNIVFDRENLKLHWSHSNCQDLSNSEKVPVTPSHGKPQNPLNNEQQSTGHGQAVAPAVAGKTPPRPSVAPPQLCTSCFFIGYSLQLLLCVIFS